MRSLSLSVRLLIEYTMRSGSIDSSFKGKSIMNDGTKIHQKFQNAQDDNYFKEVSLSGDITHGNFLFELDGRADGIIIDDDCITIDEIKSTALSENELKEDKNQNHWAQGKIYAYLLYSDERVWDKLGIDEVSKDKDIIVRLTYIHRDDSNIIHFQEKFTYKELEDFTLSLLDKYLSFAIMKWEHANKRKKSIKALEFPFSTYRKGQRELAVATYNTIRNEKRLYASAPTGIGKTISTLFPSIKALGAGLAEKIYYLSAKNVTQVVAIETLQKLIDEGLHLSVLNITAKERICYLDECNCSKDGCKYADGYYDRLNEAILDIFKDNLLLTRSVIEEYSHKHTICPFEFSLDLSMLCDTIVCDYNYVFDPRASLKRVSDQDKKSTIFLVDESHNLVERSRDMFSAEIIKDDILSIRKLFKSNKTMKKHLDTINNTLLSLRKLDDRDGEYTIAELPDNLDKPIARFLEAAEKWLSKNNNAPNHSELLEVYFTLNSFSRIIRIMNDGYRIYYRKERNNITLKLFCIDPSELLKEITSVNKATVYFSATLHPLKYYKYILGSNDDDYMLKLDSPFDPSNLGKHIYNISTKYRDRTATLGALSNCITDECISSDGNTLVFFPSFKYMNDVLESAYQILEDNPNINFIHQHQNMSDDEKSSFLSHFDIDENTEESTKVVGFAVLGGLFSEGIDLRGDMLKKAIIVGVGIPQISFERDLILDYFNTKSISGYDFSYTYPGINKIMQAAGRVIRTENDTGNIVLIDSRYLTSKYKSLLPDDYMINMKFH